MAKKRGKCGRLAFHWETKGRFRKCGSGKCALVPVFVPGNMRTYPRSGFRSGEHDIVPSLRFSFRGSIRQNHPFGKPPFCQPPSLTVTGLRLRLQKVVGHSGHNGREWEEDLPNTSRHLHDGLQDTYKSIAV